MCGQKTADWARNADSEVLRKAGFIRNSKILGQKGGVNCYIGRNERSI